MSLGHYGAAQALSHLRAQGLLASELETAKHETMTTEPSRTHYVIGSLYTLYRASY